jgi:hypothetical protein
MAAEFIKIGHIPIREIKQLAQSGVEDLSKKYGVDSLKKFCQRMGMKTRDYDKITDKPALTTKMTKFMSDAMLMRQKSMKEHGYALLLEHCINPAYAQVNFEKLKQLMSGNQIAQILGYPADERSRSEGGYPSNEALRKELIDFARYKFRKIDLVINSSSVPFRDNKIKDILIAAVISHDYPAKVEDVRAYTKTAEQYEEQIRKMNTSLSRENKIHKLREIIADCENMKNELKTIDNDAGKTTAPITALNAVIDKAMKFDSVLNPSAFFVNDHKRKVSNDKELAPAKRLRSGSGN